MLKIFIVSFFAISRSVFPKHFRPCTESNSSTYCEYFADMFMKIIAWLTQNAPSDQNDWGVPEAAECKFGSV